MSINPFRPGTTIDPKYFAGRKKELGIFAKHLNYATQGSPQNLAIMGDRGIGKSSLLRKFEAVVQEKDCVKVRRELDPSITSLENLVQFMLQALVNEGRAYFTFKGKTLSKIKSFFKEYSVSSTISTPVGGGGIAVSRKTPVLLQDCFYEELMRIWNNAKEDTDCIVFLLDEAERLQTIEGAWSFLRTVFTRVYENGGTYLLVISGKLGLFKDIKEIYSPIERFFFPLELGPLSPDEIKEAVEKPMNDNGKTVTTDALNFIIKKSEGHPFVIQVFSFFAFERCVTPINLDIIEAIFPEILERLSSQIFRDRFMVASAQEKMILATISQLEGDVFTLKEISQATKIKNPGYALDRLVEKDCLKKIERGKYGFFHTLFKEFVKSQI